MGVRQRIQQTVCSKCTQSWCIHGQEQGRISGRERNDARLDAMAKLMLHHQDSTAHLIMNVSRLGHIESNNPQDSAPNTFYLGSTSTRDKGYGHTCMQNKTIHRTVRQTLSTWGPLPQEIKGVVIRARRIKQSTGQCAKHFRLGVHFHKR